jgi:photosynthetic reaction center cytochrome c subunit
MSRNVMRRLSVGLTVLIGAIAVSGCDWPPPKTKQVGYRGVGMEQVENPKVLAKKLAAIKLPEALPPADPGGKKASQVYKNVQVLGDLTENEFLRVMSAITEWVSPEQGCNYCHNANNLAEDSVYTKIVARRMLQMTANINETWKPHVGATGVTCYTCHAGNPVPKNIWFQNTVEVNQAKMAGYTAGGQNAPNKSVGLTSMIADPFSPLLNAKGAIRVQGTTALPINDAKPGVTTATLQSTEQTYALMIHMSEGLGVNCTFCHNSRSFGSWSSSTPQRVTSWHGIQMVRDLNGAYLDPLQPVYPEERLGKQGDAAKAFCSTCHQGLNKPLNGAQMSKDYPELARVSKQAIPLPTTPLNRPAP